MVMSEQADDVSRELDRLEREMSALRAELQVAIDYLEGNEPWLASVHWFWASGIARDMAATCAGLSDACSVRTER